MRPIEPADAVERDGILGARSAGPRDGILGARSTGPRDGILGARSTGPRDGILGAAHGAGPGRHRAPVRGE
jgi:hypothetical protein